VRLARTGTVSRAALRPECHPALALAVMDGKLRLPAPSYAFASSQ
jgi:hypothetical protein